MSTTVALVWRRRPRRSLRSPETWIAFLAALVFGAIASGSIAFVRASRGEVSGAGLITVAVGWGALLLVITTEVLAGSREEPARSRTSHVVAAQLAGLVAAAVCVHVVLRRVAQVPLIECPAQLVNDAALLLPVLAVAWLGTPRARQDAPLLAAGVVIVVSAYAGTRSLWHFDPFPGRGVQDFVLVETTSTLAALWIFDLLRAVRRHEDR